MSADDKRLLVGAILVVQFAVVVGIGIGLTVWSTLTLTSWQAIVQLRVLLAVVSGGVAGGAFGWLLHVPPVHRAAGVLVGGAAGVLVSVMPVLCLLQGPRVVEGAVRAEIVRGSLRRSINATIEVTADNGEVLTLSPIGVQASHWQQLAATQRVNSGDRVRLTVLEPLDVVLSVERLRGPADMTTIR